MSVLLALLHPRVACEEPLLVQRGPGGLIAASQGPRNTMPDRARLTGVASSVHGGQDVESPLGVGHLQRLQDAGLQRETREILFHRPPVDENLSAARQQPHPCYRILPPTRSPRHCLDRHRAHLVRRRASATSSRQTSLVSVQSADAPRRDKPSAASPTSGPSWSWEACRGPLR